MFHCLSAAHNCKSYKNGSSSRDAVWGVDSGGPTKEPRVRRQAVSPTETGTYGENMHGHLINQCCSPGGSMCLLSVDKLNVSRKGAAVMWPLATSTVTASFNPTCRCTQDIDDFYAVKVDHHSTTATTPMQQIIITEMSL